MWGASFSTGLDFQTLMILYFKAPIIADCFSSKVYFGTCFHLCMTKIGWHKKQPMWLLYVVLYLYIFFLKGCKKMGHKKSVVVWLINSKTLFFSHLPRVPPSESFDLSRAGEEMRAFTESSAENQSWSVCGVCKGARQCGRRLVTTSVIGMRFPPDSGTICDLVYLIHLFHYYLFHKTASISLKKKKNKRKKKRVQPEGNHAAGSRDFAVEGSRSHFTNVV